MKKWIIYGNLSMIACYTSLIINYSKKSEKVFYMTSCKLELWGWIYISVMETLFFKVCRTSAVPDAYEY